MNTTPDAQDNPVVGFRSPSDFIKHLLGPAAAVAIGERTPEGKAWYCALLGADGVDPAIAWHLGDNWQSWTCTRKNGSTHLVEKPYAIGAYPLHPSAGGFLTTFTAIDVDGPDHVTGMTEEKVIAAVASLYTILADAGLNPIRERSHGGKGEHIWVAYPYPVPAAFAKAVGDLTKAQVAGAAKIEVFPKQERLRSGQRGSLIGLPLCGKPPSPDGGKLFTFDGRELGIAEVRTANVEAVRAIMEHWSKAEKSMQQNVETASLVARFKRILHRDRANGDDYSDIGLEAVCYALGDVADDRETEGHIIGLLCPHHAGSSLHVCPDDRWWKCHACDQAGAGSAAEFLLAKWLMQGQDHDQVHVQLQAIRAQMGTPP